jgi:hypothetical protein
MSSSSQPQTQQMAKLPDGSAKTTKPQQGHGLRGLLTATSLTGAGSVSSRLASLFLRRIVSSRAWRQGIVHRRIKADWIGSFRQTCDLYITEFHDHVIAIPALGDIHRKEAALNSLG